MEAINTYSSFAYNNEAAVNNIANALTQTNSKTISAGMLLLRSTIGIILFVVGAGKVFGWFGGYGLDATLGFYTQMGIALPLAYLSIYTEFLGGLLLTIGLLTRPAAFAIAINFIVATIITLPAGFLAPNGAAYPFVFFVIATVILIAGPMSFSIDTLIVKKYGSK